MSLPSDFESKIKEEFSDYGWEIACCFSFIAEYWGYKVLDISAVETALKITSNIVGANFQKYVHPYPINLQVFATAYYYWKVHDVLIRQAKNLKSDDKNSELDRQSKVLDRFREYCLQNNIFYESKDFVREFLINTLTRKIQRIFTIVEAEMNKQSDHNL